MSITFSSSFYVIKSKFDAKTYIEWMNNFISIVNPNFNLVIYTDEYSKQFINTCGKSNIKIVVKPMEQFHTYKLFKDSWIKNHERNTDLNKKSCWQLNMLWSEKIAFVKQTIDHKLFDTEFYGWCDIGYFRNRKGEYTDTHTDLLMNWPNPEKIKTLRKDKIIYGCINNTPSYLRKLIAFINNKNSYGLPVNPIPTDHQSISGGFFILHKDLIKWWFSTYYDRLHKYFFYQYLVKDDQVVLADCIFSDQNKFALLQENMYPYDNWFMFQRKLM